MRPLKLTMRAFGPYATEQIIDFRELQGRNLFLITGPTGSGKTTIFDAICYAVYGKASGRDRDGESLRSHFADESLLTSVELEFELKGKHFWIRRIPKQLRRKARGEGFTEHSGEAEFKDLDNPVSVVDGVKQVDDRITKLLGINVDQFKQIIMIPQGEFRELLTANSSEREDILQKIFGTEGFRLVQEKLTDRERILRYEVKELGDQRQGMIQSLEASNHEQLAQLLDEPVINVAQIVSETQAVIHRDQEMILELEGQIREKENLLGAKQKQIFTAQANNRKLDEKDRAELAKNQLEARKTEVDLQKETLEKARKALTLKGMEDHYVRNSQIFQKRLREAETAEKEELRAFQTLNTAKAILEEENKKDGERQRLNEQLIILKGLAGRMEEIRTRRQELTAAESTYDDINKVKQGTREKLIYTKETLGRQQIELEDCLKASREYIQTCADRDQTARILTKARELQAERAKLDQLQTKITALQGKLQEEEQSAVLGLQRYERAHQLYLEGLAGVLAESLQKGDACPVCGSVHHPRPAARAQEVPSEEQLKSLDGDYKKARNQFDVTKSAWDILSADYLNKQELIARIQDELERARQEDDCWSEDTQNSQDDRNDQDTDLDIGIAALEKRLDLLNREVRRLAELQDREETIRIAYSQNLDQQKALESSLENIAQEEKDLAARVSSLGEVLKRMEEDLPSDISSWEELNTAVTAAQKAYDTLVLALESALEQEKIGAQNYAGALSKKESAHKNHEEAKEEMEHARKVFTDARMLAGFNLEEEYDQAKLSNEQIELLGQQIKDYQESLRSAKDYFAKLALEVQDLTMADISILEEELDVLRQEKDSLSESHMVAVSRQKHNDTLLTTILDIGKRIGCKEAEYEVVGDLANAAKGNNSQRISFERYVLAAFFQDIVAAANIRLDKMTYGRYRMNRMIEKGKGLAQSGLELEVFDYYTGRSRHVKTLSGGESFQASLALALGLADVVQSYAGGVSLETMFVDEGFGTLDPESLDSAVNCLMELQHTGRMVGIISHVPELKASIEARLEVTANKDGSKADFYF